MLPSSILCPLRSRNSTLDRSSFRIGVLRIFAVTQRILSSLEWGFAFSKRFVVMDRMDSSPLYPLSVLEPWSIDRRRRNTTKKKAIFSDWIKPNLVSRVKHWVWRDNDVCRNSMQIGSLTLGFGWILFGKIRWKWCDFFVSSFLFDSIRDFRFVMSGKFFENSWDPLPAYFSLFLFYFLKKKRELKCQ